MSAADDILKVASALTNEAVEIVMVVVNDGVAARVRTASGTILHEGTGTTSDEAITALQTVLADAAASEAAALDAKAAALRNALK